VPIARVQRLDIEPAFLVSRFRHGFDQRVPRIIDAAKQGPSSYPARPSQHYSPGEFPFDARLERDVDIVERHVHLAVHLHHAAGVELLVLAPDPFEVGLEEGSHEAHLKSDRVSTASL